MVQPRFGQADISRTAQITVPDALREGPFHTGPSRISGFEGLSGLSLPSGLKRFMRVAGANRQTAPSVRRLGTLGVYRTGLTSGTRKLKADHGLAMLTLAGLPLTADLALRAGRRLGLPIAPERGPVEPVGGLSLPTGVWHHRS